MILVLAGTLDGREIAAGLSAAGYKVIASVVSDYGRVLAEQSGVKAQAAAMTDKELEQFIRSEGIRLIIDATHPYAVNVSKNAAKAAEQAQIPCLRYERPSSDLPAYHKLLVAQDMPAAAALAVKAGSTVFLTTGSHTLSVFRAAALQTNCRLIARVLPQPEVISACLAAGFSPGEIVAVQGPFSQELNMALFREFQADVMVTKNSGAVGGTDSKIAAAMALEMTIIVVQRPPLSGKQVFGSVPELLEYMKRSSIS
ncbi:MAG TPA: precorrin-6A reductase [Negativicutes bacterium]|nr:precorrin-6A reductase [Negativicutes bacterium]